VLFPTADLRAGDRPSTSAARPPAPRTRTTSTSGAPQAARVPQAAKMAAKTAARVVALAGGRWVEGGRTAHRKACRGEATWCAGAAATTSSLRAHLAACAQLDVHTPPGSAPIDTPRHRRLIGAVRPVALRISDSPLHALSHCPGISADRAAALLRHARPGLCPVFVLFTYTL